jgi:hypothetical protein
MENKSKLIRANFHQPRFDIGGFIKDQPTGFCSTIFDESTVTSAQQIPQFFGSGLHAMTAGNPRSELHLAEHIISGFLLSQRYESRLSQVCLA